MNFDKPTEREVDAVAIPTSSRTLARGRRPDGREWFDIEVDGVVRHYRQLAAFVPDHLKPVEKKTRSQP